MFGTWPPNQQVRRATIDGSSAAILGQSDPVWVVSVVKNNPGDYTVNFVPGGPAGSDPTKVALMLSSLTDGAILSIFAFAADSADIHAEDDAGAAIDAAFYLELVGNN